MYKPMRINSNVLRKWLKLSFKALKESLSIKASGNSKYMSEDKVIELICILIKNTSAESAEDLAKDVDALSPDVLLRKLKYML
ncbi:MAG: hypothetical protein RXR31_02880 [Thermoproteota archaeon]